MDTMMGQLDQDKIDQAAANTDGISQRGPDPNATPEPMTVTSLFQFNPDFIAEFAQKMKNQLQVRTAVHAARS